MPPVPPAPSPVDLDALLQQYSSSAIPKTARIDVTVRQKEPRRLTISESWKYGKFLVLKGTEIAASIISHYTLGPVRKSWGIEVSRLLSQLDVI